MSDPITWALLTLLIFLCWPWPKSNASALQLRRIEEKLDAILKQLQIDFAQEDDQLLTLVRAGDKIQAIKLYRDRTGVSLKEAKDYVDSL